VALSEGEFIFQGDTSSEDASSVSEHSPQADTDFDFSDTDWDFLSHLIGDNSSEIAEQDETTKQP
jgi:hypothetical protein